MNRAAALLAALALAAGGCGGGDGGPPGPAARAAELGDAQLAGQRVVTGFPGESAPVELRNLIRAGRLGGVILFARNFDSGSEARALVRELQSIPRPPAVDEPLLVMVDQEGGAVRRIPGPPALSAAQMGAAGEPTCRRQGRATGELLRSTGVNVDLAPVLDVARPGSAIETEGRSFGDNPGAVAVCGVGFADGLVSEGVAPAAKHFPGLGAAGVSTDEAVEEIGLSRGELRMIDELPYGGFVGDDGAPQRLVMLSSAVYPAFGPEPASLNPRLADRELRERLGFEGVSITDALDTPSFPSPPAAARAAARAGTDLLLFAHLRPALRVAGGLRDEASVDRVGFEASVARALALRETLGL